VRHLRWGLWNGRADIGSPNQRRERPLTCGFWCPWQASNLQPAV
jgi:hypothetical protein